MSMYDRDWYREHHAKKSGRKEQQRTPNHGQSVDDFLRTKRKSTSRPAPAAPAAPVDAFIRAEQGAARAPAANIARPGKKHVFGLMAAFVLLALVFQVSLQIYRTDKIPSLTDIPSWAALLTGGFAQQPNGKKWPAEPGYLEGYPVKATNGQNSVTINNNGNAYADVHIQLLKMLSPTEGVAVRNIFIPAGKSFQIERLEPGYYKARVMNVRSGDSYEIDRLIALTEQRTNSGMAWMNKELTLNSVGGNTRSKRISSREMRSN